MFRTFPVSVLRMTHPLPDSPLKVSGVSLRCCRQRLFTMCEEEYMSKTTSSQPVSRLYKSRVFEMIFSEKKELLSLYNALNGTTYDDPDLLEINTLENAIYMSMRNDISFVIASRLNLYEHQSTINGNLPLRFLMYTSDLFSVLTREANLYSSRQIKLPTPRFVVFYNGKDPPSGSAVCSSVRSFPHSGRSPFSGVGSNYFKHQQRAQSGNPGCLPNTS